ARQPRPDSRNPGCQHRTPARAECVKTFALLPAGGQSRRMGQPKLALPLGGRTVLGWVIAALRDVPVDHVLVVIGPHVPELVPLANAAGADVLQLSHETSDMRATVEHGLRALEERWAPRPGDAWFLVPADHPALDASVPRILLEAQVAQPQASIVIP